MNIEDEVRKLCDDLNDATISSTKNTQKHEARPQISPKWIEMQELQRRRREHEREQTKIPDRDLLEIIRSQFPVKTQNRKVNAKRKFMATNPEFASMVEKLQFPSLKMPFLTSEWLIDIPNGFAEWIMIPCPKGPRNLVVAHNGLTRALTKTGFVVEEFFSCLPGGCRSDNDTVTVLDCILDQEAQKFYILDILYWADQDCTTMEFDCRMFVLKNHLDQNTDLLYTFSHNDYEFHALKWCNSEKDAMKGLIFNENLEFEIDGFLFYDPKVLYIPGQTSLIGWLLPWMLPEILNVSIPQRLFYETNKNLRRRPNEPAIDYITRFEAVKSNKNMYKSRNHQEYQNSHYQAKQGKKMDPQQPHGSSKKASNQLQGPSTSGGQNPPPNSNNPSQSQANKSNKKKNPKNRPSREEQPQIIETRDPYPFLSSGPQTSQQFPTWNWARSQYSGQYPNQYPQYPSSQYPRQYSNQYQNYYYPIMGNRW